MIYLNLFDDQVISYRIDYGMGKREQTDPVWDNVKELVDLFSKTSLLPKSSAWNIQTPERATLSCSDFKIEIVAATNEGGTTRIAVSMLKDFSSAVRKRWDEDNQKRREAFKP